MSNDGSWIPSKSANGSAMLLACKFIVQRGIDPDNTVSKTILAIVIVPFAGTLCGIFGYGWYTDNVKPIVEAKEAVASKLLDPSSADYRNVRIISLRDVCGEVNAK